MTYIEDNRGYITASKIKDFIKSPEAYFIKYVKEVEIVKEDSKSYRLGTAFDDYFSYGEGWFHNKYFLDKGYKVDELKQILRDKRIAFGDKDGKDTLLFKLYGDITNKVRLTEGETETLFSMIMEAKRQPLWDLDSEYEPQKQVIATYKDTLKLKGTLDRLSLEKEMVRDFKTTSNLGSFQYELASKFGYDISMAFYYALVHIAYGVDCDVILDVVQTSAPYPSEVFVYSKGKMAITFNGVIRPALDSLHALHLVWEETKDDTIWQKKSTVNRNDLYFMDSYPFMETAIQTDFTFM